MIFVFGSNTQGRHGAGAAKEAFEKWGARWGKSEGWTGNSYAIVTKNLQKGKRSVSLELIELQVKSLISFAKAHPDWQFLVTPIGCGLAGFKHSEIAPFFKEAPVNMELPLLFKIHLK